MSRVADGHFRRKREAPLILRGSTAPFRDHPRTRAQPALLHLPWAAMTFRSVVPCAGIRTRSDRFVTSVAFRSVVRGSTENREVVHPCGSQRGSQLAPMARRPRHGQLPLREQ